MKYSSSKKFSRFFSILFIFITIFCVLFTLGYFFSKVFHNPFIGIIILSFYIYTYYCHNDLKETILKKYYVEREDYDIIFKELSEKKSNNTKN